MISAFEVYLVLQLDVIRMLFFILGLLTTIATVMLLVVGVVTIGSYTYEASRSPDLKREHDEYYARFKTFGKRLSIPAVLCVLIATFIPGSKTAAAMIIVPALTSKDVVEPLTAEAKDLYALAKSALTKVVEAPPTEVEKSE